MRVPGRTSFAAVLFLLQLHSVLGSYLITTPRKWTAGSQAQICMTVSPEDTSDQDEIRIKVFTQDQPRNHFGGGFWGRPPPPNEPSDQGKELIPEKVLKPHAGMAVTCDQLSVPFTQNQYGRIELTGSLGGTTINETKEITFATNVAQTFIQTDKYLYKAGQKVQFRVLTLQGPFFKVSTEAYPEIIVETPSGSRIAQWLNVSNPSGLIHLDMQLIDEPEEGVYRIKAKSPGTGETVTKTFKIEDYVLPRFEVTIKPPKYLLADSDMLKIEVCATYTFGQPLRGNVSINLSNNAWGRRKIEMNLDDQVFGCKPIEVPLRSFDINSRNYFVNSISIKVKVEEEGTGNTAEERASVDISRTALKMDTVETSTYQKPELPYVSSLKATFPDGSPAVQEPMSVCVNEDCRNLTTNDQGILKFALPPHLQTDNPKVTSLNYPSKTLPGGNYPRTYMYESSYRPHSSKYYSPSNSSLMISPETTSLQCQPGETISLTLPVMFSATNVSEALLYVQVVSRGQIQYWNSETVSLAESSLSVDEAILVAPMQPPASSFTVRGTLQLTVELPPTVSPTVKVVIWYSRPDGEVVSDARELKLGNCLEHSVDLSWAAARAEQGTPVPLTMTAEPSSLCSLGIVDKSVELLGASEDSLTLDKVFEIAERTSISPWTNSQIDDYQYCKKKTPPTVVPDEDFPIDAPATELPEESATEAPVSGDDVMVAAETEPLPAVLEKERVEKRSIAPFYRYNTNYVDALKMFDESGLYIISDLTYETRPCSRYEGYPYAIADRVAARPGIVAMSRPGPRPAASRPPPAPAFLPAVAADDYYDDVAVSFTASVDASPPRTYFPETWLWELTTVQESGTSVQELTLPNTVTEWVGRAVCVHPSKGLGISPPARVTAFTPFFIDLTVLPTVKKGEVMPVIISVFNYLEDSLPVRITLEASPEYEILGAEGPEAVAAQEEAGVRSSCIPTGDKNTVTVRIRPMVVGDVNVTVSAVADPSYPDQCGSGETVNKVDRIISPIIVEYEGFPREKTWTKYMCSEDLNENLDFFDEWRLEAPADIVPESERAWVTVVGDLLGPTLENLGNLIKMPYGCGEQNMLNFAPNIFVLQYLEASNQATEAVAEKITRFMKSGYQRELNYKHRDGSYSAFGESDNSGSTWLTAFVVKSFAQSRQYIDVDATELSMSTDWLKNRQLENGCFESVGKVLHKGMKGGLAEGSSPGVLSAYVMAALLEAGEDPTSKAVASAVFCLEAADKETQGPYYAALKAYTYSLAQLPAADLAISDLLALAVDSPTGLYWELPATANSHHQSDGAVSPVAVETAGYALLAMMARDPELYSTHGHRLVKWISGQRNSQGGFISTQDTVVALQALAVYESYQSKDPLDLDVTVTGEGLSAQFKLVESNKLLTQRTEVPSVPTNIILDMAGTGCTLVQAVVRYNIRDPEPSEAFHINVSTSLDRDSCKSSTIRVCASYLLNDEESNMAVIEVALVSGYIPDKKDLKQVVGYGTGIIKRYEVDGNKVLFYVDQFTAKQTCVEFSAIEEMKVEDAKPGTVKVYDYYEPEFAVSAKYEFPRQWFCNLGPVRPLPVEEVIIDDIIVDEEVIPTTEAGVTDPALDDLLGALDDLP